MHAIPQKIRSCLEFLVTTKIDTIICFDAKIHKRVGCRLSRKNNKNYFALSDNEVADVANFFMGHVDKIHWQHYRQTVISREI